MKNILVINGHQKYPFSSGRLNSSLADTAIRFFKNHGGEVKLTLSEEPYDVSAEIDRLKWADAVFLQTPLNWMGVPWSFKKYIDDVWTAGMMGELSDGDGRSAASSKKDYGLGGKLRGKYMISLTANAPREAFNNTDEPFFRGISEDDLLRPMHLNFKWIGLDALPTFVAYDVMKDPRGESELVRLTEHLAEHFLPSVDAKDR